MPWEVTRRENPPRLLAKKSKCYKDGKKVSGTSVSLHSHRRPLETNNISHVIVGRRSREQLGEEVSGHLEKMTAAPDRPEHFVREHRSLEPLEWIDEREKHDLIYQAYLANIAYCERGPIETWSCGLRCRMVPQVRPLYFFENNATDIAGYIAISDEKREIYAAFRGTRTSKNWLYNFYYTLTTMPWKYPAYGISKDGPRVHQGFATGYESISLELIKLMVKVVKAHPNYVIKTMGHSLGGCLATLFALELNEVLAYKSIIHLTTYEAPRLGDEAFATLVRRQFPGGTDLNKSIRVTHANDVVVHVPPYFVGFRHAAQEYFIPQKHNGESPKSAYACSPTSGEDPRCSDDCLGYSIDDHLLYPPTWDNLVFGRNCSDDR